MRNYKEEKKKIPGRVRQGRGVCDFGGGCTLTVGVGGGGGTRPLLHHKTHETVLSQCVGALDSIEWESPPQPCPISALQSTGLNTEREAV